MKALTLALSASLAVAFATVDCSMAPPAAVPLAPNAGVVTTTSAVIPQTTKAAFRDELRTLFLDNATWFRLYLVDAVARSPGITAPRERLMRNQTDVGRAFEPFYGSGGAARLTSLLQAETNDSLDTVNAAVARDAPWLARATEAWYASADELASFFARANPRLSHVGLSVVLRASVDAALDEVTARVAGDWAIDAESSDGSRGQALAIADILTEGMAARYPSAFRPSTESARAESFRLVMRDLFYERAATLHEYVVERVGRMPAAGVTARRLMESQMSIARPIALLYGAGAADHLIMLLREEVSDATGAVEAALAGREAAYDAATRSWYDGAEQTASFLMAWRPALARGGLDGAMRAVVTVTLDDLKARREGRWDASAAAADALRAQSLRVADALGATVR
jgi:hypothetical protein